MMPFRVRKALERCILALLCLLFWTVALNASGTDVKSETPSRAKVKPAAPQWGTSDAPFAANSPWNSRPMDPVLADTVIPPSKYSPAILANGWSTGVFVGKAGDPSVIVRGRPGSKGLWDVDAHAFRDVRIPRWPADVKAASESDGHADIVDPVEGMVHSFWQLHQEDGQWTAAQYAWASLRGRGWGDPAHYFQGARATGVPAMAGLIRQHEVADGAPMYRHALALSLTANALSPDSAYVFPATSADKEASNINSGKIPQGALLMLPAAFDTSQMSDARIRKIAETLKAYGGYVVDRNDGTPFIVYAEIGSDLNLHSKSWNNAAVADLEKIRLALRQVVSARGWIDGRGRSYIPRKNLNLISMRGPWKTLEGNVAGVFDSWTQSVKFPKASVRTVQEKQLPSSLTNVAWARPVASKKYQLAAVATGGAKLRLKISDAATGKQIIDSGELNDAESFTFVWPPGKIGVTLYAISGIEKSANVSAELRQYLRKDGKARLKEHKGEG